MNFHRLLPLAIVAFAACNTQPTPGDMKTVPDSTSTQANVLTGTYKLVSGKLIKQGDTTSTYPVDGKPTEMIKIFNASHFAFFNHDLDHGKGKDPVFTGGGGTYTFDGKQYTEHLMYLNHRDWEGKDFHFNLTIKGDTLIQQGFEKIENLNINQEIIEIYVKQH